MSPRPLAVAVVFFACAGTSAAPLEFRFTRPDCTLPSVASGIADYPDTLAQWVEQRRRRGFDASCPCAWLATDFLVQRHSYAKVLAYFQSFRASADANANFQAVFGESLAQSQQGLEAHPHSLLRV